MQPKNSDPAKHWAWYCAKLLYPLPSMGKDSGGSSPSEARQQRGAGGSGQRTHFCVLVPASASCAIPGSLLTSLGGPACVVNNVCWAIMTHVNLKTHTDIIHSCYLRWEATKAHKATPSTLQTSAGEHGHHDISTSNPVHGQPSDMPCLGSPRSTFPGGAKSWLGCALHLRSTSSNFPNMDPVSQRAVLQLCQQHCLPATRLEV